MQAFAPKRDTEDETMLVADARRGDETAIRALIKRHNRRLYRTARAVLRDDAEAEDVVQETYVRAFTSLASFRGESAFSTWLTRIALNEALGRARRKRPTATLDAIDTEQERQGASLIMFPTASAFPSPEAALAQSQLRHLLEAALNELPEPFRLVFMMRDVEEMSVEETAALLDIRQETVKTRLHRARRLMRAALHSRIGAGLPDILPFDGARCDRMADRVLRRLAEQ